MAKKSNKKIKVLVAHDNRLGPSTTKAHKFAEKISKNPNFETILDKEYWNPMEKTSKTLNLLILSFLFHSI